MCVKNVQVIARGSKHALIGPGMRERLRAMVGYFGLFVDKPACVSFSFLGFASESVQSINSLVTNNKENLRWDLLHSCLASRRMFS